MTESEKRRQEDVNSHWRDRFCSESSQSFSEKDSEVDKITYTDKKSYHYSPKGSCTSNFNHFNEKRDRESSNRRTLSHCGVRDVPKSSKTVDLTSKQIKKAEAQKVWQRLTFGSQVNTVSSTRNLNFVDRTLKKGGPHDEEFFKCFTQYLEEAISRLRGEDLNFERLSYHNRNQLNNNQSFNSRSKF